MSAHEVSVVIRGKNLKQYEPNLEKILNRYFDYDWFYGTEVTVSDDEISVVEQTKNCDIGPLIKAIKKGLPEAEEVYYHMVPYWKTQDINEDSCDDEFIYWSKNREWRKKIFGDARFSCVSFIPYKFFIKDQFAKAKEALSEDGEDESAVISEAYCRVVNCIYDAITTHEQPCGFALQFVQLNK